MSNLLNIKGIGKKIEKKLHQNNIFDVFNMIQYFPSRYEDYTLIELKDAIDQTKVTLKATVTNMPQVHYLKHKLTRLSFSIVIEDRNYNAHIFNREYLSNILSPGTEIVITGKIDRLKKTITAQTLKLERNFNAELEPIYNIDGI
ncbi:MAG: hypothetical protein K9L74_07270, partial [Candidatus Izimaplasma sp.]|nr:hypothetical protein [Candidatus Izimaplasma bacterium]